MSGTAQSVTRGSILRVLIVDDSFLVRERLGCRLAKIAGVDVVGKACDVPAAIEAFDRLLPDVVVLDLQMHKSSGLEVLEHIKRNNPGTFVVILTNYPLPQLRKKCTDAGAEFFFDKTCEFVKVSEVLQNLLRQRSGEI